MLSKILKSPIYDIVKKTSLDYAPIISQIYNNNIYFKREDQQLVKSFKIRGAYQKICSLPKDDLKNGLITASAGNHAQGVALSAKHLNCKAIIVMPVVTPSIKWKSVQSMNAEVILKGNNFDEAYSHALELSSKNGSNFIHPFDDEEVIAGQGTIGMELCNQWNFKSHNLDAIFVPIGGGGLASGIGFYLKTLYPNIKIIGVEPCNANAMKQSLNMNKIIKLDKIDTFADGVAVRQVGNIPFKYCQQYVDEIIECTTDEICESIQLIFEETRSIIEPAGALSLTGLINYIKINQLKNKNFVSILSGSNMNFTRLRYIAERSTKDELLLCVKIKEKPGSLKEFCTLLNSPNITEFNYRYSDKRNAYIFVGINTCEKNEVISKLKMNQYETIDISENELCKTHTRYQIGGKIDNSINELLYRFDFPERQGALLDFLSNLSDVSNNKWNITLFHYRNTGSSIGNVLCGLNVPKQNTYQFKQFLKNLEYQYVEETNNSAYKLFY